MAKQEPFAMFPLSVAARTDLTAQDKVVYCILRDILSAPWNKGRAAVGQRQLARQCGTSQGAVKRSLRNLVVQNLIVAEPCLRGCRGGYRLGTEGPSISEAPMAQSSEASAAQGCATGGAPVRHKRLTGAPPTAHVSDSSQTSTNLFPDCAPADKPPAKKRTPSPKAKAPKKPREPDPIWDAVVSLFYPSLDVHKVPVGTAKVIGKAVAELRARGATPDDITTRKTRHETGWRGWPACKCTVHAIVKNWDDLRDDAPDTSRRDDSPARIRTGKYDRVGRDIVVENFPPGKG